MQPYPPRDFSTSQAPYCEHTPKVLQLHTRHSHEPHSHVGIQLSKRYISFSALPFVPLSYLSWCQCTYVVATDKSQIPTFCDAGTCIIRITDPRGVDLLPEWRILATGT